MANGIDEELDDSQIIAQTFGELRHTCEGIATLLRTADEIVSRQGWISLQAGRRTSYSGSDALLSPTYWLPRRFFRYFSCKERTNLLAYVAIVFDPPVSMNPDGGTTILTAGILQYESAAGWNVELDEYSIFDWHLYRQDRTYHGHATPHAVPFAWNVPTLPMALEVEANKVRVAATVGRPIHEVSTAEILKNDVIDPLLALY
ncbi:MAG: hypothetical protein R3C10_09720 [Pirellulales bacterium]